SRARRASALRTDAGPRACLTGLDPFHANCHTLRMLKPLLCSLVLFGLACAASAADHTIHTFKKIRVTDQFWAEGAHFGDFNKDGQGDVVAGPYWWEGPDFKVRHEY